MNINEIENLELRSKKVRNIIGKIPPLIIRIGTSVLFLVTILLFVGSIIFKYQYIVKTSGIIIQKNSKTFLKIKLPANEIDKIAKGQKVFVDFSDVPYLYDQRFETSIQFIPDKLTVSDLGGFYYFDIVLHGYIKTTDGTDLIITDKTKVKIEILTKEISFFNRIMASLKE